MSDQPDDLSSYLESAKPAGFSPYPSYSADGDFLTVYFADVESYAETLSDMVTIYRSMVDGSILGYKVGGVRGLIGEVVEKELWESTLMDGLDDDKIPAKGEPES